MTTATKPTCRNCGRSKTQHQSSDPRRKCGYKWRCKHCHAERERKRAGDLVTG